MRLSVAAALILAARAGGGRSSLDAGCRAVAYRLCEQGELPHVRISNVIRVVPAALARSRTRDSPPATVTMRASGIRAARSSATAGGADRVRVAPHEKRRRPNLCET